MLLLVKAKGLFVDKIRPSEALWPLRLSPGVTIEQTINMVGSSKCISDYAQCYYCKHIYCQLLCVAYL